MLSLLVYRKVITISGFYCTCKKEIILTNGNFKDGMEIEMKLVVSGCSDILIDKEH